MEYEIKRLTKEILKNYSGFFETLQNLTKAPKIETKKLEKLFDDAISQGQHIYVAVVEEGSKKEIIGTAKIYLEYKLIRGGSKVAHVEDVATRKGFEKMGIGRNLVKRCVEEAKALRCYKVVLDCPDEKIPFYEKSEFEKTDNFMRLDFNK